MIAGPLFIVMEGMDGSGTTTQGDMLAAALRARGMVVHRTSEPSSGEVGRLIRRVLRGQTDEALTPQIIALLFAADRIHHCDHEIGPALARGESVVCDRYLASSLSFQVVDGDGGITTEWLRTINQPILEPDISFLIDVPVAVAMARIEARGRPRELYEHAETLAGVRQRYKALFADPEVPIGERVIIAGDRPREWICARTSARALELLEARGHDPWTSPRGPHPL